jgi:hypothetical protein
MTFFKMISKLINKLHLIQSNFQQQLSPIQIHYILYSSIHDFPTNSNNWKWWKVHCKASGYHFTQITTLSSREYYMEIIFLQHENDKKEENYVFE